MSQATNQIDTNSSPMTQISTTTSKADERDEKANRLITVISSDKKIFQVRQAVAAEFGFIEHILYQKKEFGDQMNIKSKKNKSRSAHDDVIRLPDGIPSAIFERMLHWVDYHLQNPYVDIIDVEQDEEEEYVKSDVCQWDKNFMDQLDNNFTMMLTNATGLVELKGLRNVCCKTIASWMTNSTVEEIRAKLNIVNDFTPEEEEKLIREQADWFDANQD